MYNNYMFSTIRNLANSRKHVICNPLPKKNFACGELFPHFARIIFAYLILFPNPDLVITNLCTLRNLITLPSSVNQAAIGEIKVHLIGKGDNCDVC